MGAHFPVVELDTAIRFSTLSRMSGFLWHSSKWACQFGHSLQYTSGIEVLACSLDANLNYVTTMFQLHLSWTTKFLVVFWKADLHNSSSVPSWTWGPMLNFPVKCMIFKILSRIVNLTPPLSYFKKNLSNINITLCNC